MVTTGAIWQGMQRGHCGGACVLCCVCRSLQARSQGIHFGSERGKLCAPRGCGACGVALAEGVMEETGSGGVRGGC
eukprot:1159817-Pelagomonas_calceolata.AAC.5